MGSSPPRPGLPVSETFILSPNVDGSTSRLLRSAESVFPAVYLMFCPNVTPAVPYRQQKSRTAIEVVSDRKSKAVRPSGEPKVNCLDMADLLDCVKSDGS